MKYFAHISLRLQTLCSFSVHSLTDFAYKSAVTNPMFIFTVISVAFRLQICGYKPYVRVSNDSCSISHTNPRLQTLCSLSTVLHINLRFQTFFAFSLGFLWYFNRILRLQTLCSFHSWFP